MGAKHYRDALKSYKHDARAKDVLLILAYAAHDDSHAFFIDADQLASDASMSYGELRRCLKLLSTQKYIELDHPLLDLVSGQITICRGMYHDQV